jgi:hypothetical protein
MFFKDFFANTKFADVMKNPRAGYTSVRILQKILKISKRCKQVCRFTATGLSIYTRNYSNHTIDRGFFFGSASCIHPAVENRAVVSHIAAFGISIF